MRKSFWSVLLILLGFNSYSQIIEDTSIKVVSNPESGIIKFESQDKIDSIQIIWMNEVVFQVKNNGSNSIDASSVPRNCYYIVFTTEKGEKKPQKLFFNKEMMAEN